MRKAKRERVTASIDVTDVRALRQMAEDNGRSIASQIRIAVSDCLKKDGRKI